VDERFDGPHIGRYDFFNAEIPVGGMIAFGLGQ
jgi:hypothetical protein